MKINKLARRLMSCSLIILYNKIMRFILLCLILSFSILPSFGKTQFKEKEYQDLWCQTNKGITEYRLDDGARVDCVTETYAIEFDFAHKWAESIGQSLYYSKKLCKKPGIVIIVENPQKDSRYLTRLKLITEEYGIKVWVMTPEDLRFSQVCNLE